jgi:hypothetical protein
VIIKFNSYIKEHIDIDPYGEEDWEEDNLTPLLQIVRNKYP